ncbi:MAG TPA: flagellar hook-length control protein FliK [Rhizobiaceae bacterium]|nr:flagellar hook-length control protein FliK [Rhizobiaceae bacterium]
MTGSTTFGSTGSGSGTLLGQTASSFVSGIESAQPWAAYMNQAAYMANMPVMGMSVRSLSIALQPARLGSVTANLHLSGDQLRIEVEVGTEEARLRLSSDADDIVKSLRSLGFDVSHITIKHGGSVMPTAAAANQSTAQGQGNAPFQASTNSGGGSGGSAAGSNAGNNNGDNGHAPTPQPTGGDGGSHGLYI